MRRARSDGAGHAGAVVSVVHGLVLPGYRALRDICAPLADEWSRCFCVIDVQAGPIDSLWLYESPENEALVESLWWTVPAFANTSTHGLRPGALPALADHVLVDEWSYYFAIDATEPEALRRATALAGHIGDFSELFMRSLPDYADLFVCHVDGWWELYTGRADWYARLMAAWPECRARPLEHASRHP
jgi:hypothetical protein